MTTQAYKTVEGGSIDYAHYMAKGRQIRSQSFYSALRAIAAFFSGFWAKATRQRIASDVLPRSMARP